MNKMLKITVISAVFATAGFAQQSTGVISGDLYVKENAVMEIGKNISTNVTDGVTIHNYGIIQGPACSGTYVDVEDNKITHTVDIKEDSVLDRSTRLNVSYVTNPEDKAIINGSEYVKIVNYNHVMEPDKEAAFSEPDWADKNYFRPIGGGKAQGAVDISRITLTERTANLKQGVDDHNGESDVLLLTTDCFESNKTMILKNDGQETIVNASIANEIVEIPYVIRESHSLEIEGNFRFNGDQSRFNQENTKWTTLGATVKIGGAKAFPKVPVEADCGSKIIIDAKNVEISKNVNLSSSQFNVTKGGHFKLTNGAILTISAPKMRPILPANTNLSEIKNFENSELDDSWLILERAYGRTPALFVLKADSAKNKIAIMGADVNSIKTEGETTTPVLRYVEVASYDIGTSKVIDGSTVAGYKGKDDQIILKEIADQLQNNKTWIKVADYKNNKFWNVATAQSFFGIDDTNIELPYGVPAIGDMAFAYCQSLTNVTIPNSVTYIGDGAFMGCDALEEVEIPTSVTYIGGFAFNSCASLTKLIISEGVTSIEAQAFEGCVALKEVIIPGSVLSIGSSAFGGCTSLERVVFSEGLVSIGNAAFDGCRALKNVEVQNSELLIPYSVKSLAADAFKGCPGILKLPRETE